MSEGNETNSATATSAQGGSGAQSDMDWEARFKGLQKTLNAKEAEWTASKTKADSTITAMTQELQGRDSKLTDLASQLSKLNEDLTKLSDERAKLVSDAATYEAKEKRWQSLAKHPELLQDELDGLLRTDLAGEAWDKYIDVYSSRRTAVGEQSRQKVLEGASGANGSTRTAPATKESLKAQLLEAQRKGDRAAYDAAYDALIALDKK